VLYRAARPPLGLGDSLLGEPLPKLRCGLGGPFLGGLASLGGDGLLTPLPAGRGMRLPLALGTELLRGVTLPGTAAGLLRCVADTLRDSAPLAGLGPVLPPPRPPDGLRAAAEDPQAGAARGGDSGSSFLAGGLDSMATLGSLPLLVAVLVPAPLALLPATLPAPPLPARLLLREEGPEGTAAVLVGATRRPLGARGSGDTTPLSASSSAVLLLGRRAASEDVVLLVGRAMGMTSPMCVTRGRPTGPLYSAAPLGSSPSYDAE
jgi:hypothetical protein